MSAHLLQLAWADARQSLGRLALAATGVGLTTMLLCLGGAATLGLRDHVMGRLLQTLPVDLVEVRPQHAEWGALGGALAALLGGPATLPPATLEQLAELPEVACVYPKLDVHLPLGAAGGERLFGRALRVDLFMTGVDPRLVGAGDPQLASSFRDAATPMPVVLSPQLLQIYNASVAPSVKAPPLTLDLLRGFEFDLTIGRSIMLGSRGARLQGQVAARVVGESPYAMRLGISVPLAAARRLLATYGDAAGAQADAASAAILRLRRVESLPALVDKLTAMGLAVDEQSQTARQVLTLMLAMGACLGGLLLLVAALSMGHTFAGLLQSKRRDLAIYRSVGACPRHIVGLIACQAVGTGLVGGTLGCLGARLAACGVDVAMHHVLGSVPLLPSSLFAFPGALWASCICGATLAALLGALLPAWQAARAPLGVAA